MGKIDAAVKSMRLRTLPLSLAGVVLGILLAYADYQIDWKTGVLIMLTCVSLQILSNLSNELGDVLHGTDSADRVGPQYGLNSGVLTIRQMKGLVAGAVVACLVFGGWMIHQSFGTFLGLEPVCLMMLGVAAISAAMKYTLGRNPYGYRGLGDIYVFLFFGIVSVLGAYFVAAHTIPSWILLLPAAGIGFMSVCVLNFNNMRHGDGCRQPQDCCVEARTEGRPCLPDRADRAGLSLSGALQQPEILRRLALYVRSSVRRLRRRTPNGLD